jgi:hypothetical protein
MFRYLRILLLLSERFGFFLFFFGAKNIKHLVRAMQVQQQVIEVITYIASTATKFPKKCVVLCLFG